VTHNDAVYSKTLEIGNSMDLFKLYYFGYVDNVNVA